MIAKLMISMLIYLVDRQYLFLWLLIILIHIFIAISIIVIIIYVIRIQVLLMLMDTIGIWGLWLSNNLSTLTNNFLLLTYMYTVLIGFNLLSINDFFTANCQNHLYKILLQFFMSLASHCIFICKSINHTHNMLIF